MGCAPRATTLCFFNPSISVRKFFSCFCTERMVHCVLVGKASRRFAERSSAGHAHVYCLCFGFQYPRGPSRLPLDCIRIEMKDQEIFRSFTRLRKSNASCIPFTSAQFLLDSRYTLHVVGTKVYQVEEPRCLTPRNVVLASENTFTIRVRWMLRLTGLIHCLLS